MQCRVFSSIHELYPIDSSNNPPPNYDNQVSPDIAKYLPGVQNQPPVENHCSRCMTSLPRQKVNWFKEMCSQQDLILYYPASWELLGWALIIMLRRFSLLSNCILWDEHDHLRFIDIELWMQYHIATKGHIWTQISQNPKPLLFPSSHIASSLGGWTICNDWSHLSSFYWMEISSCKNSVSFFKSDLTPVLWGGPEGQSSGEPLDGVDLGRYGFILLMEMAIPLRALKKQNKNCSFFPSFQSFTSPDIVSTPTILIPRPG